MKYSFCLITRIYIDHSWGDCINKRDTHQLNIIQSLYVCVFKFYSIRFAFDYNMVLMSYKRKSKFFYQSSYFLIICTLSK